MSTVVQNRDPQEDRDLPPLPLGESKNELVYLIAGAVLLAILAFSFWLQSRG